MAELIISIMSAFIIVGWINIGSLLIRNKILFNDKRERERNKLD